LVNEYKRYPINMKTIQPPEKLVFTKTQEFQVFSAPEVGVKLHGLYRVRQE
jgi:hypothetical protein